MEESWITSVGVSTLIFLISIVVIVFLDLKEHKIVKNYLFILVVFPSFYMAISLAALAAFIRGISYPTFEGYWFVSLAVQWLTLGRVSIFPENSYPSFIIGFLIGTHIALVNLYVPMSRYGKKKETADFLKKVMIVVTSIADGIFVAGITGVIALPMSILLYGLGSRLRIEDFLLKRRGEIKSIRDAPSYLLFLLAYCFFYLAIATVLVAFVSPILNLNFGLISMGTINVPPLVGGIIVGSFYGCIGGVGSSIFSIIFAILGWYGRIKNILPYGVVNPVIASGRDIYGAMGGTIGAIFGAMFGWILELVVRQWRYIKERMREIALKERRTHMRIVEPETLKRIIQRGAFSFSEVKGEGISSNAINAMYGSQLLDKYGDVYTVNISKIEKYISEIEDLRKLLRTINNIPMMELKNSTLFFLTRIGIKNIYLIVFDPRRGPTPLSAIRYTEFAKKLFSDPTIAVNLSNISRLASEVKILGSTLVFRAYTTKFRGRDMYHIVCAEIIPESKRRIIENLISDIASYMENKEATDAESLKKAIEKTVKAYSRKSIP